MGVEDVSEAVDASVVSSAVCACVGRKVGEAVDTSVVSSDVWACVDITLEEAIEDVLFL